MPPPAAITKPRANAMSLHPPIEVLMRFRSLLSMVVLFPLLFASIAVVFATYINAERRSAEMGESLLTGATSRAGQQTVVESRQAVNLTRSLIGLSSHGLAINDSDTLVLQLLD